MAEQLTGPLTALFIYIDEISSQTKDRAHTGKEREYLRRLAENARAQAERALAVIRPAATKHVPFALPRRRKNMQQRTVLTSQERLPLTKREFEAMGLIVEGCSNKEGAIRMKIGRRTFESHRAEVMRKLNARNAADLVRKQLELKRQEEGDDDCRSNSVFNSSR